jgi:predicted metal-dependent hydrolase
MHDFKEKYGVYYGERLISFTVIRRKRKTLEIAVIPDGSVEVSAPEESSEDAIREKVRKRAAWIVKQQRWFKQFDPRTPARQYLGGESHSYLGRKYRLKLIDGDVDSVKLSGGYFTVIAKGTADPVKVELLLNQWYREKANKVYAEIFKRVVDSFGIKEPPRFQIKMMKTRWGSLSKKGLMTLNLSLIQTPIECIEYVIVHELCHVKHHNHSDAFYKLLAQRMPDWEKRKQKLEEALI